EGLDTAASDLAFIYEDGGEGVPQDHVHAVEWIRLGAKAGDPYSHKQLADWYESGNGLELNLEKALFHRVIEVRLFEQIAYERALRFSQRRLGSVSRNLKPADVLRIAREAETWRPTPAMRTQSMR